MFMYLQTICSSEPWRELWNPHSLKGCSTIASRRFFFFHKQTNKLLLFTLQAMIGELIATWLIISDATFWSQRCKTWWDKFILVVCEYMELWIASVGRDYKMTWKQESSKYSKQVEVTLGWVVGLSVLYGADTAVEMGG